MQENKTARLAVTITALVVLLLSLSGTVSADRPTHVCSGCGNDDWVLNSTTPATCTTNGKEVWVCDYCYRDTTETIPATGHDWHEWDFKKKPTCTEKGTYIYICLSCNVKKDGPEDEIPALGHNWELEKETNVTCTSDGEKIWKCSRCSGQKRETVMVAVGHKWSEWSLKEAGTEARLCFYCNKVETRSVAATKPQSTSKKPADSTAPSPTNSTIVTNPTDPADNTGDSHPTDPSHEQSKGMDYTVLFVVMSSIIVLAVCSTITIISLKRRQQ